MTPLPPGENPPGRPAPLKLNLDLDRLASDLVEQGWSVQSGALGPEGCARLRQRALSRHAAGSFRAAGVGRGGAWRLDRSLRGDEVMWVDRASPLGPETELLGRFDRLRPGLNRRLLLGLADYEGHLAVYPAGAAYRRHRDHFAGSTTRVLTTTLYLNPDWSSADGGQIRLFVPDRDPVEIPPLGGTLLVFLSLEFEHEVLPARRDRWSWTGWYKRYEPSGLP